MSCCFNHKKLVITLIALMMLAFPAGVPIVLGASSGSQLNPYLADCYRNVTYRGKVGHHFFITLPHTKSCSVDRNLLPPGLSLKGCDIEGTPNSPGKWNFQVLLEAKCHGINFGELKIPITILIDP